MKRCLERIDLLLQGSGLLRDWGLVRVLLLVIFFILLILELLELPSFFFDKLLFLRIKDVEVGFF